MNDSASSATTPDADWHNDSRLSEKWKFRFRFFEEYGASAAWKATPESRAAMKAMPVGDRIKIQQNFYAFFFSFIYYAFFLKLWRQAVILIGIWIVLAIVMTIFHMPAAVERGFGFAYALFYGMRANPLYYLKRTQGEIGWRIF
ncbi:MAG: DUF2628 domain-containing protein [Burkholderiaceae bacterium]|jgi:hypothetical protein|nr:DUF2628 domain-containing protein [Burkholderiaceae bacterium]